ncbi:MAG TPA: DUF456 domain-containing protein [Gemmatimonadaceae bacterium]|nr:DUF456 domain-containing protein [Gemmatimonadaceae bacterium]
MAVLLLALVLLASLIIIPLGLPGLWVMVLAAVAYPYATGTAAIGTATMVGVTLLAAAAEGVEFALAGRYARRYGGSRRAGWGAIVGGIVGAFAGVPVPIVGSMVGAFAGSFAGALVAELTRGTTATGATRVAWGALVGRVAAVAVKVGIGVGIAAWIVLAALA